MKQFIRYSVLSTAGILMLIFSVDVIAQDIHFSQFYMSPLTLNPATAGAYKDVNVSTNYRDQWRSVSSAYKTFAAAGDVKLLKNRWQNASLGLGLNIFNDRAGDGNLSTTQINISLATHLKIDAHQTFSAGLNGGFGQRSINFSALTWDNQYNGFAYDGTLPSGEPAGSSSFVYPDFGAGVMYQFNKSEAYVSGNDQFKGDLGLSVTHVNQPRVSFYSPKNDLLYMKYVLHGSLWIGLKNTPISVLPGFIYYRQGPAQEIKAGALIRYTLKEDSKYTGYVRGAAVSAGAYYRWNDAVVIATLLEISNYAIGVSYDVNVSSLRSASIGRGGFEIALRYVNPSNFLYQNKARF